MLITTTKIGDLDVEVHVNEHTGYFEIRAPDGNRLSFAETLEKAKSQARPKVAARKVRVSIPFITKAGERGIASGLHATQRGVLARVDGSAVQLSAGREAAVFKPDMPPERLARFLELDTEIRERERERRAIEREFEFDLTAAVRREVQAEAERAVAAEHEDER